MKHWDENMIALHNMTVEMAKYCERMIIITMELLKSNDFSKELYGEALFIEEDVNQYQVKIDEKAVETIARFQPTAIDLRYIIGDMKINTDLERISDHCINILKTLKKSFKDKGAHSTKDLVTIKFMSERVFNMFELFLDGYINKKVENGYIILGLDDEIDDLKEEHMRILKEKIKEDISCIELAIENLIISRNYERIADLVTNLAESIVYIHKGEDLRHKKLKDASKDNKNENIDN